MKSLFMTALILSLFIASDMAIAQKDWGFDPWLSEVTMISDGPVWLMVVPDGSGPALTEVQEDFGGEVDATITLVLYNYNGDPLVNYPAEDIWLESLDGGLQFCPGGTVADSNTDENGETQWIQPFRAGGHSEANCQAFVNGAPFSGLGLELHFTSPDINGDLRVDLADLAVFAEDFYTDFDPRSDFWHDGQLNIADLARFAQSYLASCP